MSMYSRSLMTLAILLVAACDLTPNSLTSSRKKAGSSGTSDDDPGEEVVDPTTGATVPPVAGGPGAGVPAEAGGYQLTVAPLMDNAGCTECHHAGRVINLKSYPFMAGSKEETARRLIASLSGTMPPPPRPKADASLMAALTTWQQNGLKP